MILTQTNHVYLGTDCKNPGSSASIDVVPLTEVHK